MNHKEFSAQRVDEEIVGTSTPCLFFQFGICRISTHLIWFCGGYNMPSATVTGLGISK